MVDGVISPAVGGDGAVPDPKLAIDTLVQADAEKGAVVHTFDPNQSPQERMDSTPSVKDRIKTMARNGEAKGLAVDTAHTSTAPTITISDTDTTRSEKNNDTTPSPSPSSVSPPSSEHQDPKLPGALPDNALPTVPDWFRIGWRAVAGLDEVPPTGHESHKELIASFLKEQYYGDWYHNAAVIIFAVIGTHFLTLFRMGWGAIIILLAFCNTYYTTSIARVRRRARDDIQRELVKTRLLSEHESAEWMNHFLDRFWLIYEPVLSDTIRSIADQILSVNTPAFLDSLRLTTFTLGNKAPRIDSVRTFPETEEDIVMMDWGISFTPNDISDMTPKQAKRKVNPKIALTVRLGRGIASAGAPILLEDITFVGSMRVKMKLMNNFPHVQIVDLTFLKPPTIDFVLKPLGGDTFGFDIGSIPGLSSFIHEMTHATLRPMMYDPNFFTLNLEQLLSGTPLDTAIGVLQVTIHNARGISANKIGGGSPDPYVSLSINQRAELARTSKKDSTHNPTWHETKFILINSLAEALTLTVLDHNEHRKDTVLGMATYELSPLAQDAIQENLVANIIRDGKPKGELRFDLSFYPVLTPVVVDGKEEPIPHTSVGIVRLTIHQAKDLDHSKSVTGELNPFARVQIPSQKEPIFTTKKMKHTRDPVWEASTEFLCSDRSSSVITIDIVDDRDFLSDPILGYTKLKLEDLLQAQKEAGKDWWPLSNCKSGRTRLSVEWKPLNMAGSLQGAGHYTPPIGIIRLWIEKAVDVKNVEATLGGKSDPYIAVLLHNIVMARTEVINNNLNPQWDQFVYVPVHSTKEVILLECMDYQHLTKDRSLGSTELSLRDLISEATEDGDVPYFSTGKRTYVEPLHQDKGHTTKGTVHFTAEFIPCYLLKNMGFDAPPNEIEQAAEKSRIGTFSSTESETLVASSPTHTITSSPRSPSPGPSDTPPSPRSPIKPKFEGRDMTKEELLKCQSGIIVFNVVGGEFKKKSRLEVLMDDGYWPILTTPKSRSVHAQFDMTGEGFIKELDFSQIYLRLNESDDIDKEAVIAEFKSDAKSFLDEALDGPAKFILRDQNMENESTVQIQAKYVPVDIVLEPRESVNNQGILNVQLLEGKDILAADRSGTSDPFAVFTFNGQKVFRSQTVKKTLNPNWNENFQVTVPSRVGSNFEVEVSDWNQIEQSKSLGIGRIDLEDIQPFVGVNKTIPLSTAKHGVKGEVHVTLLFQPSIIAKSRKNTSTFSSAGRAMTQVGSIPMGAGKGIVHGVGNVGNAGLTVVKGVFRRGHHDDANDSKTSLELPTDGAVAVVDNNNNTVVVPASAVAAAANGGGSIGSAAGVAFTKTEDGDSRAPHDYGMLKVTVLSARDLPGTSGGDTIKPYVVLKAGDKEQKTKHAGKTTAPEWDETCRFLINSDTKYLHCAVWDHKTLGKDRALGEVDIDIWNHLTPGGSSKEIAAPLREGEGSVRLRLEFERGRQASLLSTATGGSPSASRFISMRKSMTRERS